MLLEIVERSPVVAPKAPSFILAASKLVLHVYMNDHLDDLLSVIQPPSLRVIVFLIVCGLCLFATEIQPPDVVLVVTDPLSQRRFIGIALAFLAGFRIDILLGHLQGWEAATLVI